MILLDFQAADDLPDVFPPEAARHANGDSQPSTLMRVIAAIWTSLRSPNSCNVDKTTILSRDTGTGFQIVGHSQHSFAEAACKTGNACLRRARIRRSTETPPG
ncbi:MAG: hypothetical protein E5Y16_11745 [Mesorhizobium sp.]|nr:MAG: hypothetical protein E5Y16_11745 [Mesorhizobium sp.]